MKAEVYRIVARYKVRYSRDNVSAVDDHSETITSIAQADSYTGDKKGQEFFSRGDGHNHTRDLIPGGALFLGYTLQEAIAKLEEESDLLFRRLP